MVNYEVLKNITCGKKTKVTQEYFTSIDLDMGLNMQRLECLGFEFFMKFHPKTSLKEYVEMDRKLKNLKNET